MTSPDGEEDFGENVEVDVNAVCMYVQWALKMCIIHLLGDDTPSRMCVVRAYVCVCVCVCERERERERMRE